MKKLAILPLIFMFPLISGCNNDPTSSGDYKLCTEVKLLGDKEYSYTTSGTYVICTLYKFNDEQYKESIIDYDTPHYFGKFINEDSEDISLPETLYSHGAIEEIKMTKKTNEYWKFHNYNHVYYSEKQKKIMIKKSRCIIDSKINGESAPSLPCYYQTINEKPTYIISGNTERKIYKLIEGEGYNPQMSTYIPETEEKISYIDVSTNIEYQYK